MSFVAAAIGIAGAGVAGSLISADASQNAAKTIANATTQGQQIMQQNLQNLTPNYTPYINLGQQDVSTLSSMLPSLTQQFTPADLQSNLAPNYQFMLNQGLGATNMAANVGGGGSTPTTAATQFAENYAGNAYQNAFNNFQTQQSNIYNRLAGIANIGQNSVSGLSNLATGTASNLTNLGVAGAQATAAGTVGTANAITSGVNSLANAYALPSIAQGQQNNIAQLLNQSTNLSNPVAQAYPVQNSGLIQGQLLQ